MRFLLNIGFILGAQKPAARIEFEEPYVGDFTIEEWPPRGTRKLHRFRRVAKFKIDGQPDVLYLFDPMMTRATPNYLEITGIEVDGKVGHVQSWVLRNITAEESLEHPLER